MHLRNIIKTVGLTAGVSAIAALPMGIIYIAEVSKGGIDKSITPGYVIPSKLEVPLVKDLDKDGNNEVLMNYKGKSYLLMEDKEGNPIIKQYSLSNSQINLKE